MSNKRQQTVSMESVQKRSKNIEILPFFKETYLKGETEYLARGPQSDRDANDFINSAVAAFKAVDIEKINNLKSNKFFNMHNLERVHSHYSRKSLLCIAFTSSKTLEHLKSLHELLTRFDWSTEYLKAINFMPSCDPIPVDKRGFLEKHAAMSGEIHDAMLSFVSGNKQLWIKNAHTVQRVIDFLEKRAGYTFLHSSVANVAREILFYSYGLNIRTVSGGAKRPNSVLPTQPLVKFNWDLFFTNREVRDQLVNTGEIDPIVYTEYLEILSRLGLTHPTVSSCYSSNANLTKLLEKHPELSYNAQDYNGDTIFHRKIQYALVGVPAMYDRNAKRIEQFTELIDLIKNRGLDIKVKNNSNKTGFDTVSLEMFSNHLFQSVISSIKHYHYGFQPAENFLDLQVVNTRTNVLINNHSDNSNALDYSSKVLELAAVCISQNSTFRNDVLTRFINFCYETVSYMIWYMSFTGRNVKTGEVFKQEEAQKIHKKIQYTIKMMFGCLTRILGTAEPTGNVDKVLIMSGLINNLDLFLDFKQKLQALVENFTIRPKDYTFTSAPTIQEWFANTLARDVKLNLTALRQRTVHVTELNYLYSVPKTVLNEISSITRDMLHAPIKCLIIGVCNPRIKEWVTAEALLHRESKSRNTSVFSSDTERNEFNNWVVRNHRGDNWEQRNSSVHRVVNCRPLMNLIMSFLV